MKNVQKILKFSVLSFGVIFVLMLSAFAAESGTTTDSGLRLRAEPSTSSSILALLDKGTQVEILETLDGWYRVRTAKAEGYVSADYVRVDAMQADTPDVPAGEAPERRAVVTGGTINIRTGPGTDYKKITTLRSGKPVTILSEQSGWYEISFDGQTGFICGDYLMESASFDSSIGAQVAAFASQYIGVPYVYGGASPSGFDCSGLTMYVYKQFGYSLPHSATRQYNNCGQFVAKEDLQPGDLVFFSDSSHAIGHVGIYIGNNEIVHARNSVGAVTTNSLSMSYYARNYVGARRIA